MVYISVFLQTGRQTIRSMFGANLKKQVNLVHDGLLDNNRRLTLCVISTTNLMTAILFALLVILEDGLFLGMKDIESGIYIYICQ